MKLARRYYLMVLLLIFFLTGLGLRMIKLGTLPSEMHRDEVAIGYNAYSILETGRDEYGVAWPLVYTSFGDYKLPGMLYAVVISEKIFGLSPWAVRLPTALMAALLIPLSYWLAQELWREPRRSLLVSSAVVIAQWHTFLARTAYEPIMALTLFVAALVCFFKARRQWLWFIPSLLFFELSFLTYNVPLLIAPLTVMGGLTLYQKEFFKRRSISLAFLGAFFLLVFGTYALTSQATEGKLKTTIFSDDHNYSQARVFAEGMMLGGVPYRVTQLFVSPAIFIVQAFIENYLSAFDPRYLFFDGGTNPWHSLGVLKLGNLSIFALPLIFLTVYLLSRKKVTLDAGTHFVLLYLLVSPLPDALTIDAPVTNRLLDFHFALVLFVSIGWWWLVERSQYSRLSQIVLVMTLSGIAGYYVLFWSRYATLHSKTLDPLWYEGIGETAAAIKEFEPSVDRIYIDLNQINAHQLTHLYFAFYTEYDPARYQEKAIYSLDDQYSTTTSFDPYYFIDVPEKLDFGSGYERFFPEGVDTALFVVRLVEEPPHDRADRVIKDNWNRQALWQIVKLEKQELAELTQGVN